MRRSISDFSAIGYEGESFTAGRFSLLHEESLDFLKSAFRESDEKAMMVVTRHVPTLMNYLKVYKNSPLTEALGVSCKICKSRPYRVYFDLISTTTTSMGLFEFFKKNKHYEAERSKATASKNFKLAAAEIKPLITGHGACLATDKITVDGEPIDYMYREQPINDVDSGWRFFSGTETQEYIDDPNHLAFYQINTIANYDSAIIAYLHLPIGVALERIRGTNFFNIVSQ